MNLGLLIISITLVGYASNWLNWRYLNYPIVHLLYYLGALVHELSHAFFCVITGAKIIKVSIFSKQPHVTHYKSGLPILGDLLISVAPIIGGLFFLFLINKYYLGNYFVIPKIYNWQSILIAPLKVFSQINIFTWKSWLMILIFLNIGAMIGPSWQDLKNVWPIIIILFFFKNSPFDYLGLTAIVLITTNIFIQIILISFIEVIKILCRPFAFSRSAS